MQVEVQFKSLDHSQSLAEFAEDRLAARFEPYELKPLKVHVVFSREGRQEAAEVFVKGVDAEHFSKAQGTSFEQALEKAAQKLVRQLSREKNRVQKHRHRRAA